MQRIALGIEYDGTHYCGWQRQHHQISIQQKIEEAIAKIANHPTVIHCAGRTDAGVHAYGQVIHFDTPTKRDLLAWIRGVNAELPLDIRVCWSKEVENHFDARRCASARRYSYLITNHSVPPGVMRQRTTWVPTPLDVEAMRLGATFLLGEHNFNAFRAASCQAKSPIRKIHSLTISQQKSTIIVTIVANAFLHHMVRNIVGTLILVGKNKFPFTWVQEVLHSKKRKLAGYTAPASGLYLEKVEYPLDFAIPGPSHPWF